LRVFGPVFAFSIRYYYRKRDQIRLCAAFLCADSGPSLARLDHQYPVVKPVDLVCFGGGIAFGMTVAALPERQT